MEKYHYKEKGKTKERLNMISLAKLYAEVFALSPWNEYTKSQGCNTFFGLDTKPGSLCPHCKDMLQEAYPIQDTILHIKSELDRPNSLLTIIENEKQIIGFAWGFSYKNCSEFISEKYRTDEMKIKLNNLFTQLNTSGRLFYFSECGVAPLFRGRGLSNELTQTLITQAQTLQQSIVMRTNYQSPMIYVARKFNMKQIMGPQNNEIINFTDQENLDRVLFIKN
ncbi:MAG TPA: GNAT family N-acetyltransferase [Patescibacteria group bacterium]|nr:GNAT family N-acetyltransferase [Patescibacteria group bacterium]